MKYYETSGYIELSDLNNILMRISPFRAKVYAIVAILTSVSYFVFFGILYNSLINTIIGVIYIIITFIIVPLIIFGRLSRIKKKLKKEKNIDRLYFKSYFTIDGLHLLNENKEKNFLFKELSRYIIVKDILFIDVKDNTATIPVFYKKLSVSDFNALLSLLNEKGVLKKRL